jgi:hypothetical protein
MKQFRIFLSVAIAGVLTSCATVRFSGATSGAPVSRTRALATARRLVSAHGYDLRDYRQPEATFSPETRSWIVIFLPAPHNNGIGSDVSVIVRRTGEPLLLPGR